MEETENCLKVKYTLKVSNIPEEIWIYIFDFFEFKILQKVLTLVCREWFQIIRQTFKFSGKLNVVPGTQLSDINSMLNSWKVSVTSVLMSSRLEEYISTLLIKKAAERRRKNRYQSLVISCQISFKDLYIFVENLKTKLMIQTFSWL